MDDMVKALVKEATLQMSSTDQSTQYQGAKYIYSLACNNASTREPLSQDAHVIARLVDLLKQGSDDCRWYAQYALANIATAGDAVQVQILNALDAAALKALGDYQHKYLLGILSNNPKAEALLAAKRGRAQVVALLNSVSKKTEIVRFDAAIEVLSSVLSGSTVLVGGISKTEAKEVVHQFPKAEALVAMKSGKRQVVALLKSVSKARDISRFDAAIEELSSVLSGSTVLVGGISKAEAEEVVHQFPKAEALLAMKTGKAHVIALLNRAFKSADTAMVDAAIELLSSVLSGSTVLVGGISKAEAEEVVQQFPKAEALLAMKTGKAHVIALLNSAFKSADTARVDVAIEVLSSVLSGSTVLVGGISKTEAKEVVHQFPKAEALVAMKSGKRQVVALLKSVSKARDISRFDAAIEELSSVLSGSTVLVGGISKAEAEEVVHQFPKAEALLAMKTGKAHVIALLNSAFKSADTARVDAAIELLSSVLSGSTVLVGGISKAEAEEVVHQFPKAEALLAMKTGKAHVIALLNSAFNSADTAMVDVAIELLSSVLSGSTVLVGGISKAEAEEVVHQFPKAEALLAMKTGKAHVIALLNSAFNSADTAMVDAAIELLSSVLSGSTVLVGGISKTEAEEVVHQFPKAEALLAMKTGKAHVIALLNSAFKSADTARVDVAIEVLSSVLSGSTVLVGGISKAEAEEVVHQFPKAEALLAMKTGKAHVIALLNSAFKSADTAMVDVAIEVLSSVLSGSTVLVGGISKTEAEEVVHQFPKAEALVAMKSGKRQVVALLKSVSKARDISRFDAAIEVLSSVLSGSTVLVGGISKAEAEEVVHQFPKAEALLAMKTGKAHVIALLNSAFKSADTARVDVAIEVLSSVLSGSTVLVGGISKAEAEEVVHQFPKAEALLAMKSGKAQVIALLNSAFNSADTARVDAAIELLSSVLSGSTVLVGGISKMEAQEVQFQFRHQLSDLVHLHGIRQALLQSHTTPLSEHIRASMDAGVDQRTATARRCSVLWLTNAIQSDETKRKEIMTGGGIVALLVAFQREVFRIDAMTEDQKRSSSEIQRQIVSALTVVSENREVLSEIVVRGGTEAIVAYLNTCNGEDTKLATQLLEQFMVDEKTHVAIGENGGVKLLVHHLQYGSSDQLKMTTLALLRRCLVDESSECFGTVTNMMIFSDSNGPSQLYKFCQPSAARALRAEAERLLYDLTRMIPTLLQLFDAGALCTLEIMSRAPTNCEAIVKENGVYTLTQHVKRAQPAEQAPAIRILANLAYRNDRVSEFIGSSGLVPSLLALVMGGDEAADVTAAAAMALRNLANGDSNRTRIGRSGVVPRVVGILQRPTASSSLREVAAGLLGNLARQNHRDNQQIIVSCNGVAALVEFAQTATNARQRQTATMALWTLVKENDECRRQFLAADGIQVVSHIDQLNESKSQQWAKRVLSQQWAKCVLPVVHPIVQSLS